MSRFFVSKNAVKGNVIEITDKDDIKHICKVLRLGIGDKLELSDTDEFEYEVQILSASSSLVETRILDKQKFAREPKLLVTLFQGIPKQSKMETIIQKSVELGVNKIVPVFTERVVIGENSGILKKLERWRKISSEAVKQCKRGIVPEIKDSIDFKQMLETLQTYDLILFPYENEEDRSIKDVLRSLIQKPATAAVIIGPEGGFSSSEADKIINGGGKSVSLGKTVLRTETAGPAALAMIMYELEL